MRIAEVFHSIQGEGQFTGTQSVFVRTTGCNLRCWFCDTDYTSWKPEGVQRDWQDVFDEVRGYDCEHVVVTGGEPFLQPDVVSLTRALEDAGHFITIETAGTVHRPVHAGLMSISPKLSNSTPNDPIWTARHEARRDAADVMQRLLSDYPYQLKFVVDRPDDLAEIDAYLANYPDVVGENVGLMPQARTAAEIHDKSDWLEKEAANHGFHVSPRLHIERWGNARGK
jgi:7-carboxy-7-deazaguanine synthase